MSTILIVDDDPHLRELARVFLQQEGFAAKKIVELHQGTIGIASQPGAGTTLIVSLPVE